MQRTISTFTSHLRRWLFILKNHHSSPAPILPPNYQRLLLSLLLRHHYQSNRHPYLQVHSQLITTALLCYHAADATTITLCNTLIRHYSFGHSPREAIHFYKQMQDLSCCHLATNSFTFSFLLKACMSLFNGTQVHGLVVKKGFEFHVYVHTSLIDMYVVCGSSVHAKKAFDEMPERNLVTWNVIVTGLARCGEISDARLLFEQMPVRNVVSWTGMIDGYTRAERPVEALTLLVQMMANGISVTEVTVLAIVPAISNLGALGLGESIHACCEKIGIALMDVRVENSLIDMYAKCGAIERSLRVFDEMLWRRNIVSWTSVISGFAMHGMAKEAVELFERMKRDNVQPNRVTLLSVLNACSHGGLVEEGMRFFSSMVYEFGVEPEAKHFGCMIDMLGRAGRLREAERLIEEMPMEVNVIVWRTLLGCCSKHGEVEMGERVMQRILERERGYGGDYVILSNMFVEAGRYDDAEKMRRLMDQRNAFKVPGLSLVRGRQ